MWRAKVKCPRRQVLAARRSQTGRQGGQRGGEVVDADEGVLGQKARVHGRHAWPSWQGEGCEGGLSLARMQQTHRSHARATRDVTFTVPTFGAAVAPRPGDDFLTQSC